MRLTTINPAPCANCGIQFRKRADYKKQKFCSTKCAGAGKRGISFDKEYQRFCITCSKPYVGNARSKYCSAKCRNYGGAPSVRDFLDHQLSRSERRKTLTLEYLLGLYERQGGMCALTGYKMTTDPHGGRESLLNISMDRIDSKVGYVVGNIQLVCLFANRMKSHIPMEEFIAWCEAVVHEQARRRTRAA